jgi:prolyl oligopeptidase
VDTLHGTPVEDAYRWLEDAESAEVRAWFRAQGAHARSVLDTLAARDAILERMRSIAAAAQPQISLPREAGGRWFYTVRRAGEPVAKGYVRDGWTGEERLLVDPAAVGAGAGAGTPTLASFLPSPDGRLVLYGITAGGTETVVLRVRDVESGRDIEGPFERNMFDYNQWSPDGRAFLYFQLRDLPPGAPPADAYRGIRIIRHRLGDDPGADVPVFSAEALGRDDRMLPFVMVDPTNGLAYAVLTPGTDHGEWFVAGASELTRGTPEWRPLFPPEDSVRNVVAHGDDLYVFTHRGGPRVVLTSLAAPDLAIAEVVMAEPGSLIQGMSAALDGLYVAVFAEGLNRIARIPWGEAPVSIDLPPGTSVAGTPGSTGGDLQSERTRPGVRFSLTSWTSLPRAYRYDPSMDRVEALDLQPLGPYDAFDGYTSETVLATSHDETRVPLTIVGPEGALRDGNTPVLLVGYGAYGMTDAPQYITERRPFYEAGGTMAQCHVRGGGYYGQAWHRAGLKATKPNTWLDFIACAEHLVEEGYTTPERLVALGGSAGGVTVGRAITERPELFSGAVLMNGALDAVRWEETPAGPPNVHEFGSIATEEGFRALLEMSALHHVRPGTAYPAVLLSVGLNDARVAPWESGKMAAALKAATTSGKPVLLRIDEAAGHMPQEQAADQVRQLVADVYAFVMARTGMPPYRPPVTGRAR